MFVPVLLLWLGVFVGCCSSFVVVCPRTPPPPPKKKKTKKNNENKTCFSVFCPFYLTRFCQGKTNNTKENHFPFFVFISSFFPSFPSFPSFFFFVPFLDFVVYCPCFASNSKMQRKGRGRKKDNNRATTIIRSNKRKQKQKEERTEEKHQIWKQKHVDHKFKPLKCMKISC